jgi:hypothetical protein
MLRGMYVTKVKANLKGIPYGRLSNMLDWRPLRSFAKRRNHGLPKQAEIVNFSNESFQLPISSSPVNGKAEAQSVLAGDPFRMIGENCDPPTR